MEPSNICLIISDLDNTLLRSDKTVSSYTYEVLSRCKERGILVGVATARSHYAASDVIDQPFFDVAIHGGGSSVWVGDQLVSATTLTKEVSDALISFALAQKEVYEIMVACEKDSLTNNPQRPSMSSAAHYRYNDLSTLPHREAYKITIHCTDRQVIDLIAQRFPVCSLVAYKGEEAYAFSHKEATKGHAIELLAKHLQIDPSNILAFGDDANDLSMLSASGYAVAVANAIEPLQAIANKVCGTNDTDGVAAWIEANIL